MDFTGIPAQRRNPLHVALPRRKGFLVGLLPEMIFSLDDFPDQRPHRKLASFALHAGFDCVALNAGIGSYHIWLLQARPQAR